MKERTFILREVVGAASSLDEMRDALTRAFVLLEGRHGPEARQALVAVRAARDAAYDSDLAELIETAITVTAGLA